ncbi:tape measure protein [Methylosinus sp. KRF6]|uniref:tape measure protein n=1 Tax=Methylosinus sp. KRF6 TaxID=2846853 RepID=UPI001C0DC2C1|nr:tape measure protein [Methylosinus sp. KRF6]MBU3887595.1 M15 family metallopeptidase [Methylosinus sp. KRF6]
MTDSHSIQISVDASRGLAGLNALRQAVQATGRELQQLSSSGGGNAFASLSRSLSDTSRGFESLKRATRDNGLAEFNQSISALSRGMPVAAREIVALASAFIVNRNAVALFAGALGTVGLGKLASDSMAAGTAALNLRIAVDSVASSGSEAGRALTFIRQTAQDLGQPLDVATKQFASFYTSARALGKTPQTIENVWRGLSTAMSALHVGRQDQALFFKELQETYAMNKIDATRLVRSMSTHLPGLTASMSQALGITGAEMHHRFKNGGLSVDSWEKLAALLEKRYGGGVKEALDHAQGSVIALSNSFELLKQKSFDSGIDSAIAGVANTVNSILKPNVDSIASALGTAFQHGSAGVQLLMTKLYELRSPLTTIGTILAGYAAYQATFAILAAGVSFLLRPIGLAVAAGALLYATWESFEPTAQKLAAIFQHLGQGVANLSAIIADSTKGFINFGAVAAWAGEKASSAWSLLTGGVDKLANNAGYKAGNDYLSGIASAASGLTRKLWGGIESSMPDFLKPTKLVDDYKRLLDATRPKEFTQHGDYASNADRYNHPNNDLSEEQSKLYAKLSTTTAALKTYREELEKIAGMRGKIDPLSGSLIGDAEINKLREAAREQAFTQAFPAANRISEMVDKLRLEQEAIANAGGLSNKEAMQQEREFLQIKLEMKKRHVDLTREETAALRDLIRAEHELTKGGSNGFSQWANQQKTSVESMNDNIKSSLDSLADGIAKIAVEGKGKFKSLGEAIRSEFADIAKRIASDFIKAGIRDLMAQAIKGMSLDSSLTSTLSKAIGGGQNIIDKANGQLDKIGEDALNSVATANMEVQAGIVNLNASGLTGFSPSGFNANAVGGVEPKSASESLFAGNALAGRDQSITPNSVQAFAQILAPWKKGDAPNNITSNSVAEFAKIANLQKPVSVTDSAGLTLPKSLPSFGKPSDLESLFKNAGLSSTTEKALRTVDPNLQAVILRAQELSGTKIAMNGLMGARTAEQQNALFRQNRPGHWVTSKDGYSNPSNHQSGNAADVTFADASGKMRWGQPDEYRRFNSHVQQAARERGVGVNWGGDWKTHKDWDHWEMARGSKPTPVSERSFTSYAGSNVDEFKRASRAFEENMRQSTQKVSADFTSKLDSAVKQPADLLKSDLSQSFSHAFGNGGAKELTKLGDSIKDVASDSSSAIPALTGLASKIAGLASGGGGGAGGLIGGAVSLIGGLFEEGGLSGSAVTSATMPASYWVGAPAYAEGTPNTSGAMPAILHDNEAVIPLSRGREIPVDLRGAGGGGDTHVTYNMHSNVQARDFDSFRRNSNQMAADFHKMAARMHVRNN